MEKGLLKNKNCVYFIVSISVLGLVFIALHDMQTALGVGLYISIYAGAEDRVVYDIVTDVAMLIALILLIGIPSLFNKKQKIEKFTRFLFVFLAFIPQLSPAYLVHFFDTNDLLQIRLEFIEGEVIAGVLEGLKYSASLLQMIIPMFCLLLLFCSIKEKKIIKPFYYVLIGLGLFMEIGIMFFPGIDELLCFVMTYCLLLVMFDMWEGLLREYSGMNTWGWILFGGLGLRGIYRLLEMMRQFHI